MYKYNIKFTLALLVFSTMLFSCSDVVENDAEFNDLVKTDSLDISKDSIFRTVFNIKGVKGQFRKEATTSIKYVGGDLYEGLIGDFSEGVISVIDTTVTLTALAKKDDTPKLIKSSIRGSALNEYGASIAFDEMVLEAYKIVTDEDTVDVKMNIVDNLIVAKMDGVETIEAYEEAKSIVLSDLNLDSTFALNATFDDADVSDKDAGAMIAIGGLMMRSTKDVFGVTIRNTVDSVPLFVEYGEPISPSDWDLLPYENIDDPTQSFKYWITELTGGMFGDPSILDSTELKEIRQDQFNREFASICENAQSMVNSLDSNGYRNLSRFNISDEVTNSCIDYLETFFWNRVN